MKSTGNSYFQLFVISRKTGCLSKILSDSRTHHTNNICINMGIGVSSQFCTKGNLPRSCNRNTFELIMTPISNKSMDLILIGVRVAQWQRSNISYKHITNTARVHAQLCKLQKGAFDSQLQVIKFFSCLSMVGGSLRVLRLLPPLKLVAVNQINLSQGAPGFIPCFWWGQWCSSFLVFCVVFLCCLSVFYVSNAGSVSG
jgi:hypothetical protein